MMSPHRVKKDAVTNMVILGDFKAKLGRERLKTLGNWDDVIYGCT